MFRKLCQDVTQRADESQTNAFSPLPLPLPLSILSPAPIPVFAWEAYDKGSEVHLQADPTKLELLHQSFKVKKEDFKDQQKETILERVCVCVCVCEKGEIKSGTAIL